MPTHRLLFFTVPALLALFGFNGCASFGRLQKPDVELASVAMKDASLTAATFVFGLRVANPNPFNVTLDHLRYQLDVNEKDLGSGATEQSVRIAADEKSVVELPVRIGYTALYHSLSDLAKAGNFLYKLKGSVEISGRLIPFELNGALPMPQARWQRR